MLTLYKTKRWCFISPLELTASVTAIANAIACKLDNDELALLASVLTQLGDTLTTITTQRAFMQTFRE